MALVRAVGALLVLVAAVFAAIVLVHGAIMVAYPEQFEYGEGAVLELVALAARGEALYRDPARPPWIFCPYPPLFLTLAGLVGHGAPVFWPGRLISLLSTGIVAVLLARCAGRRGAAAALALFLADAVVLGWSSLYRVDFLGLAFSLGGLAMTARLLERPLAEGPLPWKAHLGPASLFTLAFLTKHSLLAAPLAVLLAWLDRRRPEASRFGLLFAGLAGGAVLLLSLGTEGRFWTLLTRDSAMPWVAAQAPEYLASWALAHAPGLVLAAWGGWLAWREGPRLWALYALASFFPVAGSGRYGAFYNYFLELHVAVAALGGLAWVRGSRAGTVPTVLAAGLLLAQVLAAGPTSGYAYLYSPYEYLLGETLPALRGQAPLYVVDGLEAARERRVLLAGLPGPALAENLGHLVVLGRMPWLCDPASYQGLAARGRWSEEALLEALRQQRFSLILLQKLEGNIRFTPRVLLAVLQEYRLLRPVGMELLFVPRGEEPAPSGSEESTSK